MPDPTDKRVAERAQLDAENDRNRLATVFLVEASDYEHHHLWLDFSEEARARGWGHPDFPRVPWEQISLGYGETIGHVGKMPVAVSVTFARVRGQAIAFYEATSQVVDYRMVERWTETAFPESRGRTNPTNFHICLHALEER